MLHQLPECSLALSIQVSSVCNTLRAYSMFIAYLPLLIIYNILQIYYNKIFTCSGLKKSSDMVRTGTGLVLDQTSLELGSSLSLMKPKALSSERVQVRGFPA